MATEMVSLPAAAVADLRWALAHGLHAIAEVERSQAEFDYHERNGSVAEKVREAMPIRTFGTTEEMTRYAGALMWLDHAKPMEG